MIWTLHRARHRVPGKKAVDRSAAPLGFKPRHCDGAGCLHDHAGSSRPLVGTMRTFAPITEPVSPAERAGRDLRLTSTSWRRVS